MTDAGFPQPGLDHFGVVPVRGVHVAQVDVHPDRIDEGIGRPGLLFQRSNDRRARGQRLLQNEPDDRRGIGQSVRMMAQALLDQHADRAAQFLVPLFDDGAVLGVGDDVIGIAAEQEEGHLGLGQRLEGIDRVLL